MKVLLLQSVPKLGKKDDVVEVSLGFANNALFPQKRAVPATDTALAALGRKIHNHQESKAIQHNLLDRAIGSIGGKTISMEVPADSKGSLFSKIDGAVIAAFLMQHHRITIDPKCIVLSDGPIKKTGVYTVKIADGEYQATLPLEITKK